MIFYLAIVNNIFSICGLAGVLNAHRELVIAFFAFNATQMVVAFHYFVSGNARPGNGLVICNR